MSNFDRNPADYHQGALLTQARDERGMEGAVRINHVDGRGRIGEQEYGIIYNDPIRKALLRAGRNRPGNFGDVLTPVVLRAYDDGVGITNK